jgi:hypothetical protein
LCSGQVNAHHLRELTFIEKQYNQPFSPKVAALLLEINKNKKACEVDHFTDAEKKPYQKRYDDIVQEGFEANPEKPSDPKEKPKRDAIPKKSYRISGCEKAFLKITP